VAPVLSVMFTEIPSREVPKGNIAVMLPFKPGIPNRLAISSGATVAETLAAELATAGSGADVLGLKLLSPEYIAAMACPSTADTALAATCAVAVPPERLAPATTALPLEVSTNCTVPVGVPVPGSGATVEVSTGCPEFIATDTDVVVAAREMVNSIWWLAGGQVESPVYWP
jgi:hypothetical protein